MYNVPTRTSILIIGINTILNLAWIWLTFFYTETIIKKFKITWFSLEALNAIKTRKLFCIFFKFSSVRPQRGSSWLALLGRTSQIFLCLGRCHVGLCAQFLPHIVRTIHCQMFECSQASLEVLYLFRNTHSYPIEPKRFNLLLHNTIETSRLWKMKLYCVWR